MKLIKWIEKKKLSRKDAAEKLAVSEGQLSRLITGSRTPSAAQVMAIHIATDGSVGFQDFFGDSA